MAAAILVALLVFAAGAKLRLRRFFAVTNVLLLLFAAGLVGKAAGELGEAGLVPPLISRLWDLNPPAAEGAPYPAFHENGLIGSFFKGLFGYSATPSLMMLLVYVAYLTGVGIVLLSRRRPKARPIGARPKAGEGASPTSR